MTKPATTATRKPTTARPAAKVATRKPAHDKDLAEMTDEELEAMALEAAEVAADEAPRPAAKVAKVGKPDFKALNAARLEKLAADKAAKGAKPAPAAKGAKVAKPVKAFASKQDLKITAVGKNTTRPGTWTWDMVEAALTSPTVAAANAQVAAKGHTKKVDIAWMVAKGFITVAA